MSATAQPGSPPTEAIEVAAAEDVETDEFDPQEYDGSSFAASTSVTSSLFEHAYENGRRVRTANPSAVKSPEAES